MAKVYESDNYSGRVNYAATCFMRGTRSRAFDTCFEMWDGDAVVVALVRRAQTNQALYDAIAGAWGGTFPAKWLETAETHKHVTTRNLPALAREMRRAKQEASDRFFAEMEAKRAAARAIA